MSFFRGDFISEALGMQTSVGIIIPEINPEKVTIPVSEMNVVYLLHGLSDNSTCWTRYTSIERYANEAGCVVIMPEVQRSMYADMKYGLKYFTYVSKELPELMHRFFNISLKREKSFIAGLSMGGFGTLKCAFTNPKRYAACAAFSAVMDVEFARESGQTELLEEFKAIYGTDLKSGKENDLFALAEKTSKSKLKPRVMTTCGTLDMLYQQNQKMKKCLEGLDLEYKYEEWEDDHNWRFWDASIQLAFDFFFDTNDED